MPAHGVHGGTLIDGPGAPGWVFASVATFIAVIIIAMLVGERRRFLHARRVVERWAITSGFRDVKIVTGNLRLAPQFGSATEGEVLFRLTAATDTGHWVRGWVKFHPAKNACPGAAIETLWDSEQEPRGFPVYEAN